MDFTIQDLIALDNMNPSDHPMLQGQTLEQQVRTLMDSFYLEPVENEAYEIWFNTPNPSMENMSPAALFEEGMGTVVRDTLWDISIGRPD